MANYNGSCANCVHYQDESSDPVLGRCTLSLSPAIALALGLKDICDQDEPEMLTHNQWSCHFGDFKDE
jgi:hypothetical protein